MGGIQTEYHSELGPAPLDARKRIANRRSAARGRAALRKKGPPGQRGHGECDGAHRIRIVIDMH